MLNFFDFPFEEVCKYVAIINLVGNSALLLGDIDLLKVIIRYDNVNVQNDWLNNALTRECLYVHVRGHPDIEKIKFLIDYGINVGALNRDNKSALMCCCDLFSLYQIDNIEEILEVLICSGADVLIKSSEGKPAYDYLENKSLLSERLLQLLQGRTRIFEGCAVSMSRIH